MDIYKHKTEGLVVFIGPCKMQIKDSSKKGFRSLFKWVNGTQYKKLTLDTRDFKEGEDTEEGTGKAMLRHDIFVVPTSNWQANVKRHGVLHDAKQSVAKVQTGETKVIPVDEKATEALVVDPVVDDKEEGRRVADPEIIDDAAKGKGADK